MSAPFSATAVLAQIQLDPRSDDIKKEMLMLVSQWLEEHDYTTSLWTLREEGGLHDREAEHRRKQSRGITAAILDGNWDSVNTISAKMSFKNNKAFQYAIARQQYLEIVASKNSQKALTFIINRLKPLEQCAPEKEFYALTYLLTCKNVHDAPQFRSWEEAAGRQRILNDHRDVLSLDDGTSTRAGVVQSCGSRRLEELLRQACAYQALALAAPEGPVHITTLLQNYTRQVVPSRMATMHVHTPRSRAITFGGPDDAYVLCGGHDGNVASWCVSDGARRPSLTGAGTAGKIWSLDGSAQLVAAACADGMVRLWDPETCTLRLTALANSGDVYACAFSPGGPWVVAGGYDRTAAIIDMTTGTVLRTLTGHTQAVTCVATNATGNVVVAGSKDGKVKFFDVGSGVCVQTLVDPVADTAVSSVALSPDGATLAASGMNSTVMLWDLATARMRQPRLKGHVNIRRNFISVRYGSSPDVIYSGSEDGKVRAWRPDGAVLTTLAHEGEVVFDIRWSHTHNVLATCAADGAVRLWCV